jgi:hypothetical protein
MPPLWLIWAPLALALRTLAGSFFVFGVRRWTDLVALSREALRRRWRTPTRRPLAKASKSTTQRLSLGPPCGSATPVPGPSRCRFAVGEACINLRVVSPLTPALEMFARSCLPVAAGD